MVSLNKLLGGGGISFNRKQLGTHDATGKPPDLNSDSNSVLDLRAVVSIGAFASQGHGATGFANLVATATNDTSRGIRC